MWRNCRTDWREFCAAQGLERFSPEEIVELLEDGEEVDWIVEQVAPGSDVAGQLGSLLKQIAEETAPMGAVGAETGEGGLYPRGGGFGNCCGGGCGG